MKTPAPAPVPVPASVVAGSTSAVDRYERVQRYQAGLRLNAELLRLKGSEARLRGENEHLLAAHVRGLIADCERKIAANGGA